jgi:hypothetical protein
VTTAPASSTEPTTSTFVDGLDSPLPEQPEPNTPHTDRRINRMHATRAENRADREHALQLTQQRRQIEREDKKARREQTRNDRVAAREERKARRAERRAGNADRNARLTRHAAAAARRFMVIGPITAPMAVAWSSQTSYAMDAFGWPLVFALGFAAAWELSTTFTGWMYHQARKSGDRGAEYRILTWVFALGAAAMNYAHHAGPHGEPTQASVAFSAMSVTGMVLWESYARLVHRQYLRDEGLIPRARPRLGVVRWVRYPVHSWTAWSVAILNADHRTAEEAWTAADRILTDRRTARSINRADRTALRSGLTVQRLVIPRVRTADHGPASIPVHITVDRPDRTAAPTPQPTVQNQRTALPTAGPDRTAKALDRGPADRTPTDNTGLDRPVRTTSTPVRTTDRADRPAADQRTTGPDRTDTDLVLTDLERTAIDTLQSTDRSISKRSIADVVRTELNGSIGSDRAAEIARHYRQLHAA